MAMAKITLDDAHRIAEKNNGKCLSKSCLGGRDKLKWQCKNGHTWIMTYHNVKSAKQWCKVCRIEENLNEKRINYFIECQNIAKKIKENYYPVNMLITNKN